MHSRTPSPALAFSQRIPGRVPSTGIFGCALSSRPTGRAPWHSRALGPLLLSMVLVCSACQAQNGLAQANQGAVPSSTQDEASAVPAETTPSNDGTLLWSVSGDFVALAADGLGNTFLVDRNGEIQSHSENGTLRYRTSEVRYGPVGALDATNPLRVMVYYPEFLTALLFSNTLGVQAEVNLRRLGFNRVRAAGLARDGRLWIYDEANFQLVKIDEQGNIQRRSEGLNYVLGLELAPRRLVERNNRLYLHDAQHGILVFDAFGTYEYRFGGPGIKSFQVFPDRVVYEQADGSGRLHDVRSGNETPFTLPGEASDRRAWRLDRDRILLLQERGLSVFRPAP